MSEILLVNPPIRLRRPPYVHPIGLAIIAQMLRQANYDVEIADINAARYSSDGVLRLSNEKPRWIGVSGIISTFRHVRKLVPFLRSEYPGVPIVIGGGGITSACETYMDVMRPDIAVLSEGEYTALELASHFETGYPELGDIAGIAYWDNGEIRYTEPRPLEKDLDKFPMPAFDLLDMEAYITHPKYSEVAEREAAILATRGCPYACNFCYHIFGRGARFRSPAKVIEEIEYLKDNYGVGALLFADEFWTANKRFVKDFCGRMIDQRLDMDWMCYSRVDALNDETVALMKRAGCSLIGFGLESGSQRMLDAMNKRTTVEKGREAWELVRRHEVRVSGTMIIGYPGETEASIQESMQFAKEIGRRGGMFYLAPYPGTVVFEENKDRILEKFGSLEEFFVQLGNASNLVINLTDLPDEVLTEHRRQQWPETATWKAKN